jgi:hypothetical protein
MLLRLANRGEDPLQYIYLSKSSKIILVFFVKIKDVTTSQLGKQSVKLGMNNKRDHDKGSVVNTHPTNGIQI